MRYNNLSCADYCHTGTLTLNLKIWGWFKCQFCHLFRSHAYTFVSSKEQRYLTRL